MSRLPWFQKIFEEFYSPLCNYAYKIIKNREDAEDIIQNLFVHFWESKSLEDVENIERYLIRSVKFKCIDYLRQSKKYSTLKLIDLQNLESAPQKDFTDFEIEALFSFFIAKLPPKTKEVFLLSRESKITYKQIAAKLNISEKTVESQMGRALKILRSLLKDYGFLSLFIQI